MTFRQDFFTSTADNGCWNRVLNWKGYRIATVGWHNEPWKFITDNSDFETLADDRGNAHCKAFRTQKDLYTYILTIQ